MKNDFDDTKSGSEQSNNKSRQTLFTICNEFIPDLPSEDGWILMFIAFNLLHYGWRSYLWFATTDGPATSGRGLVQTTWYVGMKVKRLLYGITLYHIISFYIILYNIVFHFIMFYQFTLNYIISHHIQFIFIEERYLFPIITYKNRAFLSLRILCD